MSAALIPGRSVMGAVVISTISDANMVLGRLDVGKLKSVPGRLIR